MQKLDLCDKQVMNQRDPNLRHQRIFTCSEEAFDLEILFDPLEKEFNLLPLLINSGYW